MIINIRAAGAGDRELGCIKIDVLSLLPSVSRFPSSEIINPKSPSKTSAPEASRNDQPNRQTKTSAPKTSRNAQPQKPVETILPSLPSPCLSLLPPSCCFLLLLPVCLPLALPLPFPITIIIITGPARMKSGIMRGTLRGRRPRGTDGPCFLKKTYYEKKHVFFNYT